MSGRRLQGKVAVVVGAGSSGPGWGNGKATAVLFAREGARVLCADLNQAAADETVALIEEEGHAASSVRCNAAEPGDVKAMVEVCLSRYGRIDLLDNNVGIALVGGPVETRLEDWEKVMKVNVTSMFLTCKHVVPVMLRQFESEGRGGAIVNIASIAAIRYTGYPYIAYSASKGAVVSFTRTLALQYAKQGIRANAVLPGLMKTPMIVEPLKGVYGGDVDTMMQVRDSQCPMGHMGDAWDVAHAALFLASDEARYVTGTELIVDGGVTAKFA